MRLPLLCIHLGPVTCSQQVPSHCPAMQVHFGASQGLTAHPACCRVELTDGYACTSRPHAGPCPHLSSLIMGTISSIFFSGFTPFLMAIFFCRTSASLCPVRARMSSKVSSPGAGPFCLAWPSLWKDAAGPTEAVGAGAGAGAGAERVGRLAGTARLLDSGMASMPAFRLRSPGAAGGSAFAFCSYSTDN